MKPTAGGAPVEDEPVARMIEAFTVPTRLIENCRSTPERAAWLSRLAGGVRDLERRWAITVGVPFDGDDVSCAWVAPVTLATGASAVLKLGMPHLEGEHEIDGLRFWNGDPTVRLLDADDDLGALLLSGASPEQRCARFRSVSRTRSSLGCCAACGVRRSKRTVFGLFRS